MQIRKAYKFKLKTNDDIEYKLNIFNGHCRFVWNKVFALCKDRLDNKQSIIWYNEASYWLTLWKSSEDYSFLRECHSQLLQQKLKDLNKAFKDCFDKKQPLKKLPKFKKKYLANSFRYVQGYKVDNKRIFLPKIGWVGFFKSRDIKGKIKNITISKQADVWYASIQVELDIKAESKATSDIGIDLGVNKFVTCSDGLVIQPKNTGKQAQERLARLQRKLSKKVKFSNNWRKQKLKITKYSQKTKNSRNDFLNKTSTELSKNHAIIFVEDLKIKNMTKSAKGNVKKPGKNVKQKADLNKAILDQGWSKFVNQLEYKTSWQGNKVVKVNPAYTSQKCNVCGYTNKSNRKTQELFACVQCKYQNNADINAAINIRAAGHAVLVCGEAVLSASKKQKPLVSGDTNQSKNRNRLALAG